MSQIEQIAESYEPTSRKTGNAEYGRLELYSLSALKFYTGLLGGNNSLFRSSPLGGGSLFGRESIFDRMERLAKSRPLSSLRFIKNTEYLKLFEDEQLVVGETHHSKGLGKLKLFDKGTEKEFSVPLIDINDKPLWDWRINRKKKDE